MIFVGDIALPYENAIKIKNFPKYFYDKKWFGNLEGAISTDKGTSKGVYNNKEAIVQLSKKNNFAGFACANNHIFDTGDYYQTVGFLNEINIPFCGIGRNLDESGKALFLTENGKEIIILNFGWEVIQCLIIRGKSIGVNPLSKEHVIETFLTVKSKHPNSIIILFMHWSYELEAEPQPSERELAKALIDLGASGIIGCHPHRIGGFELYKGCPIIYSLGNWMFKQRHYHNGRLEFPDFCNDELAFEWNFDTNDFYFHFFTYSKAESILTYAHTEGVNSEIMKQRTPFRDLTKDDYVKWYKNHHHHKGKGLPIYYWDDSNCNILIKNKINKFRDWLIKFVLGIKNIV